MTKGDHDRRPEEPYSMKNLKLYSFIVLTVLTVLIILQNTVEVEVRILTLAMSAPLAALLLATLLIGIVLGMLIAYMVDRKARKRHS